MDRGHTTVGYMFGFLTIEDNTGASPKAIEQAREALGKFSTSSKADLTIRNWIHSVRKDAVLMVRWNEIKLIPLSWGVSVLACRCAESPTLPKSGVPSDGVRDQWEDEEWMMSCNQTCWWRHEHRNFVRKLRGGF
jgi:hypothetical protein